MAVVLIIFSLVVSGSLRGAELVRSSSAKGLEADFRAVPLLVHTYRDKYRALPGDDLNAPAHLGAGAQPGAGSGRIEGNWYDAGAASEASRVWQHLRLAGLIAGVADPAAANYMPLNALGRPMGLQSGTGDPARTPIRNAQGGAMPGAVLYCSRGIPGQLALTLDADLDDGNPATGSMLATPDTGIAYTLGAAPATLGTGTATDLQTEGFYIVCMGV